MAAKRKYGWEQWFSRPRTVLVRGIDYHCSQSAMCSMIRNNASLRSVKVRLTDASETVIIEVVGNEVQRPYQTTLATKSTPTLASAGALEKAPA